MNTIKQSLEIVSFPDIKPTIEMPTKVLNQIKFLCREIPKEEWSGILFYKVEGTIKDIKNVKFILEDILPLDKGSASFTQYSYDERYVDHIMKNPNLEDCKMGHIHSHNIMGVFFSGTDMSELQDNAPNHNYYLSLIVNNYMDFCAKVCFVGEAEETNIIYNGRDEKGQSYPIHTIKSSDSLKLFVFDCKIQSDVNNLSVEADFEDKVKDIIAKAAKPKYPGVNGHIFTIQNPLYKSYTAGSVYKKNNNVELKKNVNISSLLDKLEEELNLYEQDFLLSVLNCGEPIDGISSLEELTDYFTSFDVNPEALPNQILSKLNKVIDFYFGEEIDRTFLKTSLARKAVLQNLIDSLDFEISFDEREVKKIEMFSPTLEALKEEYSRYE